ncbi:uncharacterized protein BO66DRAFT_58290 [Aspergillus aculeatinus CBS 121060]|uniref:Uncharacterized protein n=1 Tax=Aspergillus aculeatinus CBS 121060 TaxID=1448322 RepID=A0ACD1HBG7_9EURO|nr:hypothetical protein BO66DRAFT_58290 [Aspergillus aculeatinus CBS 121060]RAH71106.1 hypothetical protein BO66DRAFT_58290 [Aspergillus aculeatinus CBS 121060]
MTRVGPTTTQTTPHGVIEIQIMSGGPLNLVVLRTQDPRFEVDDWAPALQLLHEQWRRRRQDEHLECRDQPIGGMICVGRYIRLYIEPLTADGHGPARRFEFQGRNEFDDFGPHVQPSEGMPPIHFLEFIRTVRAARVERAVSQPEAEGDLKSDTKTGLQLIGLQLEVLEYVKWLSLEHFESEGEVKKGEDEEEEVKKEEEDEIEMKEVKKEEEDEGQAC